MEMEIKGKNYRVGKLDAMKQFHIARRLAPILWSLNGAAQKAEVSETSIDNIISTLGPVTEAIAKMSDEECDYIIKNCLSVVHRQETKGWAKIQAANGALMFEDIEMQDMMKLTVSVIQENLGSFFPGQPNIPE